jgi:hypothetical protein
MYKYFLNIFCIVNTKDHLCSMKLHKTFKKGGGFYSTTINGQEVTIEKQYSSSTWIAQTWDGKIDIQRDTLKSIRQELDNLKN